MERKNIIETALESGRYNAGEVRDVNGVPFAMLHKDMRIEELEAAKKQPTRIKQNIELTTAQSFIDYYTAFATDRSVILCDMQSAKFKAIIDYHGNGSPDWCCHTATYQCPHSVEWQRWIAINGKPMEQETFALFLENNVRDIIEPAGARMLEIALTLEAKTSVNFKSALRIDNGETKLTFDETIDTKAGVKGDLIIPTTIAIGLRVFDGEAPHKFSANFRYRITNGKAAFWLDYPELHRVKEDAVQTIVDRIVDTMKIGKLLRAKI